MRIMKPFFVLLLTLVFSTSVHAYTGPGLGLGLIGTIVGVLFSVLLAVLAVFWYPLKRMVKGNKSGGAEEEEDDSPEKSPSSSDV